MIAMTTVAWHQFTSTQAMDTSSPGIFLVPLLPILDTRGSSTASRRRYVPHSKSLESELISSQEYTDMCLNFANESGKQKGR